MTIQSQIPAPHEMRVKYDQLLQAYERLQNEVREHRAGKKPVRWTIADKELYSLLPEVVEAQARRAA